MKGGGFQGDLATALAVLRTVRGWSQQDLAKATGLRSRTISDYERGKMIPGLKTAQKLLEAQGYSMKSVEKVLSCIELLRSLSEGAALDSRGDEAVSPASLRLEIEQVSAAAGKSIAQIVRLMMTLLLAEASTAEPAKPCSAPVDAGEEVPKAREGQAA
jgi:transcriptional regulator with XRE-family HTH domain